MKRRILIVDDEPSIRKVLTAHLQRFGYEVDTAPDGGAGIEKLQSSDFHLVVTDLQMPVVDGMALLRWANEHQPALPVVIITAHGTVDSAVESIKAGAFDYVTKPFDQEELRAVIAKGLSAKKKSLKTLKGSRDNDLQLIGQSPAMQDLQTLINKVAPSPTPVLITGQSGTGKELVAQALHKRSKYKDGPFIPINCGAIPENLFEAELFGYERGAFTGAVSSKPGRFELAHNGTVFLDEIGELPKEMQVKLLRALQDRRIERVGGITSIDLNCRIVAASNVNLRKAIENGTFREDLFYRLNVIPIHLPPLRDRKQDITLLVEHFIQKFNKRLARSKTAITPAAMQALHVYHWPGNIRELENLMERVMLLMDGDTITPNDLPWYQGEAQSPTSGMAMDEPPSSELPLKEYVRLHTSKLERTQIIRALEAENGNVTRAARKLGISRKSLQLKMKEYALR